MLPSGVAPPLVISDPQVAGAPLWSSDSKNVAFTSGSKVAVVRIADGHRRVRDVSDADGPLTSAAWSPNDRAFAVATGGPDGIASIKLVDAQTGATRSLATFPPDSTGVIHDITWSPDGAQVLFTRLVRDPQGLRPELWVVDAASGNRQRLYDSGRADGADLDARFSPDGVTIAFNGNARDGAINVFLIDRAGASLRQLTHSVTGAFRPRWWPPGTPAILYFDDDNAMMNLTAPQRAGEQALAPRPIGFGLSYEWAPLPGTLPVAAIPPTTNATSTRESMTVSTVTPAPETKPVPAGFTTAPSTGGGPDDPRPSPIRMVAMALSIEGGLALALAFAVRRRFR